MGLILLGEHDRKARLPFVAGMNQRLEGVQPFPTCAGDDDFEKSATGEGFDRRDARHPEHIMPDAFPVVPVVGMGHGLFDQCAHGGSHSDMHTGEVLGGDSDQVARRRVNQDAVGDGLRAGVNGNHGEAVERLAGLIDNVAGLMNRVTGEITHGIWESCAPTRARQEQRAALRGPHLSQTLKKAVPEGCLRPAPAAQGGAQGAARELLEARTGGVRSAEPASRRRC